ncbi:uncharacterized protein VTP21DRAFT_9626 [Calcarisporiella thermophila]|uniref:uncharacterized protein n=1 Tax=Calcarisporiella thermophila TaxID=911321 RepID=UPI0037432FEE
MLNRLNLLSKHLKSAMAIPNLTLYTAATPNGHKASITLEELDLPYNVKSISFAQNEQKSEWFTKINPNGRIPALTDHSRDNFNVFESGAIMIYLCEHYDPNGKLYPKDPSARSEVLQWLMFQMGGVGPMQGQASHFYRYSPEKIEYGIKRYQKETRRLYEVIEKHLSQGREWLAAGQFSLADIANFTWIRSHQWAGVSIDGLPNLKLWLDRIEVRPAVQRGLNVPEKDQIKQIASNPELAKKTEESSKAWILKGQQN